VDQTLQNSASLTECELRLFGRSWHQLRQHLAYDPPMVLLLDFIEQHYMEPDARLGAASRACGVSKNSLNRRLRLMTGLTYLQLLSAYRVLQSISKALAHDVSFTQIALDCGFGESSSYCRTVKRILGRSPKDLLPRSTLYKREVQLPEQPTTRVKRKNLGVPKRGQLIATRIT
jgi:AraC-like DNA-binding protein